MAKNLPTTDEAFRLILDSDYYWSLTGLDKSVRRNYRHLINSGRGVTIDKKEEMLKKAQFSVEHEKTWNLPE